MSEAILEQILEEIKKLNTRLDRIEWLFIDSKLESEEPSEEDKENIEEYNNDLKNNSISFKKFV